MTLVFLPPGSRVHKMSNTHNPPPHTHTHTHLHRDTGARSAILSDMENIWYIQVLVQKKMLVYSLLTSLPLSVTHTYSIQGVCNLYQQASSGLSTFFLVTKNPEAKHWASGSWPFTVPGSRWATPAALLVQPWAQAGHTWLTVLLSDRKVERSICFIVSAA